MEVIEARGVNDAYFKGMALLTRIGLPESSRAGDVLVSPVPVTTVYSHPMERVLFDVERDANPLFHLFESLHMLAGRNDAKWLDLFVSDFSSRFAEEDGIQHGAYGYRWRHALGFDQLDFVIQKLRKDPTTRQCVLQMWDARDETINLVGGESIDQTGYNDLRGEWKDRPCNTSVMLRVRTIHVEALVGLGSDEPPRSVLDITVTCRSNDVIWGAYGANAVHFSVLHEYLAAQIGVRVGTYYHVSNNFHGYLITLGKVGVSSGVNPYVSFAVGKHPFVAPRKMITHPSEFNADLKRFMYWTKNYEHGQVPFDYVNPWFANTAEPLYAAAERWRAKKRQHALEIVLDPAFDMAPDWRLATKQWMERRLNKAKVA